MTPTPDGPPLPRLLLVDGRLAYAQAVAQHLARQSWTGPVDVCTSMAAAMNALTSEPVGAVVLVAGSGDGLPGRLEALRTAQPGVPMVVLAPDATPDAVVAAVRAGALGWVPTSAGLTALTDALRDVTAGRPALPDDLLGLVLRTLTGTPTRPTGEASGIESLTYREQQVLAQLADGLDRHEVAEALGLSVNTVRTHVQHVLIKLDVHSTLEAVALYLREQRRRTRQSGAGRGPAVGAAPGNGRTG